MFHCSLWNKFPGQFHPISYTCIFKKFREIYRELFKAGQTARAFKCIKFEKVRATALLNTTPTLRNLKIDWKRQRIHIRWQHFQSSCMILLP